MKGVVFSGRMIVLDFSAGYSNSQEPIFQETMNTPDLNALDQKIKNLVALCQKLKEQNRQLRSREQILQAEREQLIEKNAIARSKVEAMISRLKALEHES